MKFRFTSSNNTRFPYATPSNETDDLIEEEGLLLRAADLIGQLGDPNYIRKSNALFHEFEEIGLNKTLGYATPADIVYKFPQFYFSNVAPQIQKLVATPIAEIEQLIAELQQAKAYLQSECERLEQETARYLSLTQLASETTTVISDSISQWHPARSDQRS